MPLSTIEVELTRFSTLMGISFSDLQHNSNLFQALTTCRIRAIYKVNKAIFNTSKIKVNSLKTKTRLMFKYLDKDMDKEVLG